MCETLAGVLTGGGTAGPEKEDNSRVTNGMLSFHLDAATFGSDDIAERVMEYAVWEVLGQRCRHRGSTGHQRAGNAQPRRAAGQRHPAPG
jgi:hypothetical protein